LPIGLKLTVGEKSKAEFYELLGRLLRVDLVKPVSNVRPSVRPQKVYSISMKFGK